MNLTNNAERDVDLSSICQIRSRLVTPYLKKSNFNKFSPFSPNSVAKTNFNTEKKKEKSLKKEKELFILNNVENMKNILDKKTFFEENEELFQKKFKPKKNITILKSTFLIEEINSSNIKKKNSSKINNCIFTENKIFYNPVLLKNAGGHSHIKFKDCLKRKEEGHVKKSTFKLKKFNFFKVFKKSQKYYLKDLKTVKKTKKVRKKRRKKYITCHCKTTECLKLYCECKKQNEFCNRTCKCLDCKNTSSHQIL